MNMIYENYYNETDQLKRLFHHRNQEYVDALQLKSPIIILGATDQ